MTTRTYVSRAVFLFLLPFATVLVGSYWLFICSYARSQVTRARCRQEVACSITIVRPEGYRVLLGFLCVLRHLPSPDAWRFLSLSLSDSYRILVLRVCEPKWFPGALR